MWLGVVLACAPSVGATPLAEPFVFENTEVSTVVAHVSRVTGIPFLFDPEQVKGTITLLAPGRVSAAKALELLESALAMHGYRLVGSTAGMWIVPGERLAPAAVAVEVVTLKYARADEVADTLAWVAPPGVRIVPHHPTNSVIISGPPVVVEKLIDIIE